MTTETTVRGYACHGSVRGGCGCLHRTIEAAEKCLARDQAGCKKARGYSDRTIVVVGDDGYLYMDQRCQEWVPGVGGRSCGAARFVRN